MIFIMTIENLDDAYAWGGGVDRGASSTVSWPKETSDESRKRGELPLIAS
jgi:hypothetical protein